MRHLGHIDSSEIYFCSVDEYVTTPVPMASITSTLALVDSNGDIDDTVIACLRNLTIEGAAHVILTGANAYEYERELDDIIVESGIELLQHAVITTIPIVDLEEAINLAVCMDEQAVLLIGRDLNDLMPGLIDFGMEV